MAQATAERGRDYVRVPSEMQLEVGRLAARYDVPVASLTRLLLCLGLEVLRVDKSRVPALLAALSQH